MTGATPLRPRYRPRQIEVQGQTLSVFEVSPQIDPVVDTLLDQALGGEVDWSGFATEVRAFVATDPSQEVMDDFFSCLTPVWNILMRQERFERANDYWQRILDAVIDAEGLNRTRVHKGSGYYFWGTNALQRGDTDRGLTLLYEAVVEDLATFGAVPGVSWPAGSAASVITLDGTTQHPLSWWVAMHLTAIDADLTAVGSTIRAADLRRRLFLVTEPANVFLFVHAFASLIAAERLPPGHRTNEFVARLILGHLFHVAVVVERVLKPKQGNAAGLFADQGRRLSNALGGLLQRRKPGESGTYSDDAGTQARRNPEIFLQQLLAGTAAFGDGSAITPTDRDICIAHTLRNEGGHQSAAPLVIAERAQEFRRACLAVLANAVAQYYP